MLGRQAAMMAALMAPLMTQLSAVAPSHQALGQGVARAMGIVAHHQVTERP